jgi:hypothetical protein
VLLLGGPGFDYRKGIDLSLRHYVQTSSVATHLTGTGGSFLGGKAAGAWSSPPLPHTSSCCGAWLSKGTTFYKGDPYEWYYTDVRTGHVISSTECKEAGYPGSEFSWFTSLPLGKRWNDDLKLVSTTSTPFPIRNLELYSHLTLQNLISCERVVKYVQQNSELAQMLSARKISVFIVHMTVLHRHNDILSLLSIHRRWWLPPSHGFNLMPKKKRAIGVVLWRGHSSENEANY